MGNFTFTPTGIPGLTLVDMVAHGDERGYFMETYHREAFATAGITDVFVQDNESASSKGVLRGLHYQRLHPQGKLVRVISGEVYDVAVDLRPNSPTFRKWYGVTLSAANRRQLYVPQGFAHGYLVLSEQAAFCYKCTDLYAPQDADGIRYDDPDVGVEWPVLDVPYNLLARDAGYPPLAGRDLSFFARWYG